MVAPLLFLAAHPACTAEHGPVIWTCLKTQQGQNSLVAPATVAQQGGWCTGANSRAPMADLQKPSRQGG